MEHLFLLTDMTTEEPIKHENKPHLIRKNVNKYEDLVRQSVPMDKKEALVYAMLKEGSPFHWMDSAQWDYDAPLLICDTDAIFKASPFTYLYARNSGFWLGDDPGNRMADSISGVRVPERNAGVMWLAADVDKRMIAQCFDQAWKRLFNEGRNKDPLLGQKAWSIAHYRLGKDCILPRFLNWSHWWDEHQSSAAISPVIHHFHGPKGKAKLQHYIVNA